MKFISLQENLKKGLNIVGHITTKNINLPILNNILIKVEDGNIELTSTNLEIGIKHKIRGKIETSGEFTVDSKLITEYISFLTSGEKVKIEQKNGELKIESGNYKTKIKGEDSKEFPLIPTINQDNNYSCKISDLKKALSSVIFATSNSENRVELTGVLFFFENNILSLVATDSYRLSEKKIKVDKIKGDEENKIIIPAKTAQELLRILNNLDNNDLEKTEEINIIFSDNQVLFSFDSVDLISRLLNGRYPDYKQIIPSKSITEAIVDRNEIIRGIKATSLFSKTGINDITIIFSKKKIIISAFSGSSGESQVEIDGDINGDDNEVTINFRYILDGLNSINSEKVILKILNNNTPCLIKPNKEDDHIYIVMPIKQ